MKKTCGIVLAVLLLTFGFGAASVLDAGGTADHTAIAALTDIKLADIKGHWAEASIQKMVRQGIVSGFPDGTFRPGNTVTRAEFATMLAKMLDMKSDGENAYLDMRNGHWSAAYVMGLIRNGILVPGETNGIYGPNQAITRGEMAKMMARALAGANPEFKQALADLGSTFLPYADRDKIDDEMRPFAALTAGTKILRGLPDATLSLDKAATRAEAVVILDRLQAVLNTSVQDHLHLREFIDVSKYGHNGYVIVGDPIRDIRKEPISLDVKNWEAHVKYMFFIDFEKGDSAYFPMFQNAQERAKKDRWYVAFYLEVENKSQRVVESKSVVNRMNYSSLRIDEADSQKYNYNFLYPNNYNKQLFVQPGETGEGIYFPKAIRKIDSYERRSGYYIVQFQTLNGPVDVYIRN